ncbi:sigma 54-interacting transcriptional regulator [Bacillus sp. 2205SS5-2]|uniref:sigma 54-interacting transcriptional regulator n=1 Tax=Bacillus sp. 2205SS5-2 TaxID=3109031 RepID=UPI0030048B0F
MILREIMTRISIALTKEDTLEKAVKIMKQLKFNVIPVINHEGRLCGVFTRTSMHEMILSHLGAKDCIGPYVINKAVAIEENTPYHQVEAYVRSSSVGTGVVVDDRHRPIGLFTKTDMISALFQRTQSFSYQLQQILQSSQLGAIMTDEQYTILFNNEKAGQLLNQQTLEGRKLYEFFPSLNEGKIKRLKVQDHFVLFRMSSFERGLNQKGYISFLQDVSDAEEMASELKVVQQMKNVLETAMEHAYDGIVMVNKVGEIQLISPPMCELFSIERKSVLGKSISSVLPQLNITSVIQTHHAEVSDVLEIQGIKYIVNRLPIIEDGEVIGAIGKVTYRQLDEVKKVLKKLEQMENQVQYYKNQLKQKDSSQYQWEHIRTRDEEMEKLIRTAIKAARGLSTILIRGESGTGKELFAHSIHASSGRQSKPFVTVNCAAIPEQLLESEFFGYEEGAFTGAAQKGKIGKFDLANGGTLFLDEIGDMSLTLQAKMLRVLQEKEFYRVGGTKRVKVDVRIIGATNQPLERLVEEGDFREDLYYRLNVISLHIPPLRNRSTDVELLVHHFMEHFNSILGTSVVGINKDALQYLRSYHWPGNVRELSNVIERAMTFAEHGQIQKEDLPDNLIMHVQASKPSPSNQTMRELQWDAIEDAITVSKGNKSKAAELLGISRSSLYEKLKKLSTPSR